jgi:hypothetical protein
MQGWQAAVWLFAGRRRFMISVCVTGVLRKRTETGIQASCLIPSEVGMTPRRTARNEASLLKELQP